MTTIERFIEGLCRIPEAGFNAEGVEDYLRATPVDPGSLERYLHFTPTHYTRNLVYRCPLFELMTLCWDVGQQSRIHNHAGQRCWMAVPFGRLEVQNYEVVAIDSKAGRCELKEANRFVMDPAHPGHVQAELPVHAVINPPAYGARAASLHVYSKPYDRCLVYSLENKSYTEVPLFFDTEYGQPVGAPATSRTPS
jgi:predicted metal-dependent enzyme (double-stranded beta helix superfamily)